MSKNNYFKGCYFKCSANDKTISFIPAFHRNCRNESTSLQIITDNTAFNIPFDSLKYRERPLSIEIGNNIFSGRGIKLNIQTNTLSIHGELAFNQLSPIKYDIMGPFQYVPFMQCRHSIYSTKHTINGQININDSKFIFKNGDGYIEGDRGYSFPEKYIWTQCCFKDGSLMLSAASIPLLGTGFTGIIGIIMINKKEYRLATYLGAKIKHIDKDTIIVKQRDYLLSAKLIKKNAHPLYAPVNGKMSRTIHESASCKAYYKFLYKENIICEFISDRASFELEYN